MSSRVRLWSTALLALILLVVTPPIWNDIQFPSQVSAAPDYWPTDGWRSTSPEAQEMSSFQLQAMETYIRQLGWGHLVRSVVIIRNGYIVWETYFDPAYGPDQRVNIFSCTKSVTSALMGIAIDEGHIVGVNETLLSFFTGRTIANQSIEKDAITLEQVLTMTSGLAWDEWPYGPTSSYTYMTDSPDWTQYALDRPMRYSPGAVWDYNSGGSHLLSMVINQTVGNTTLAYADSHLFAPLGITDYEWETDPQGVVAGGSNLHLTPRDMAKFGYLLLNNGTWDGEEVVPLSWVNASTADHVTPYNDTDSIGYGYHWWINRPINTYLAIGYNGQQINVVPEHNLVVVFTAWYEQASFTTIMEDYIIPAIGYLPPPLPVFPLSFDQIAIIAFALMGAVIAIPLVIEGYLQIRNRRRPSVEESEPEANDTAAEEAPSPIT
jgi:CubicO group peptidase (beta-lactamase class C family)